MVERPFQFSLFFALFCICLIILPSWNVGSSNPNVFVFIPSQNFRRNGMTQIRFVRVHTVDPMYNSSVVWKQLNMCIRYFYKCFQGKLCCQKFLSINMVFHFVNVKCPSSANIVADSSSPKTTCIRWNFNNRFTFRNIIFGTIYVIPALNIN